MDDPVFASLCLEEVENMPDDMFSVAADDNGNGLEPPEALANNEQPLPSSVTDVTGGVLEDDLTFESLLIDVTTIPTREAEAHLISEDSHSQQGPDAEQWQDPGHRSASSTTPMVSAVADVEFGAFTPSLNSGSIDAPDWPYLYSPTTVQQLEALNQAHGGTMSLSQPKRPAHIHSQREAETAGKQSPLVNGQLVAAGEGRSEVEETAGTCNRSAGRTGDLTTRLAAVVTSLVEKKTRTTGIPLEPEVILSARHNRLQPSNAHSVAVFSESLDAREATRKTMATVDVSVPDISPLDAYREEPLDVVSNLGSFQPGNVQGSSKQARLLEQGGMEINREQDRDCGDIRVRRKGGWVQFGTVSGRGWDNGQQEASDNGHSSHRSRLFGAHMDPAMSMGTREIACNGRLRENDDRLHRSSSGSGSDLNCYIVKGGRADIGSQGVGYIDHWQGQDKRAPTNCESDGGNDVDGDDSNGVDGDGGNDSAGDGGNRDSWLVQRLQRSCLPDPHEQPTMDTNRAVKMRNLLFSLATAHSSGDKVSLLLLCRHCRICSTDGRTLGALSVFLAASQKCD